MLLFWIINRQIGEPRCTEKMHAGHLTLLLAAVLATLLHAGHATCPTNYVAYKDYCYAFGQEKVNWVQALALCRAYGGNLLEVRSSDENNWIVNEIKARKMGTIWLGSSDIFFEGTWRWLSDVGTLTFSDWNKLGEGKSEPNNAGGIEHCLEIRDVFGYTWNDRYCEVLSNVVCKTRSTSGG